MAHTPAAYADARQAAYDVLQLGARLTPHPQGDSFASPLETDADHVARITGPDYAGCARTLRDAADALEALWDEVHDGERESDDPGEDYADDTPAGTDAVYEHGSARPVRVVRHDGPRPTFADVADAADRLNAAAGYGPGAMYVDGHPVERQVVSDGSLRADRGTVVYVEGRPMTDAELDVQRARLRRTMLGRS